jgi:hypothetical protein
MYESERPKAAKVIGPFGPLTIADLPSPGTQRWSIRCKATVIAAVRGGLLSLEEACRRYALNVEEYLSWEYCIDRYGPAGLRTTRTQVYLTNGGWQRDLRRYSTNRDRRTVRTAATWAQQQSAKPCDIEDRTLPIVDDVEDARRELIAQLTLMRQPLGASDPTFGEPARYANLLGEGTPA